ncbi:hypothetical protein MJG53_003117 [Ovis ammon polii x Ovis aries]|uniref:Uncharacterized protein n=1 Tax=Ovis ammon polii x Ovis aries TaxID=2918886 RepID=A0ACB9VFD3_9CETA|nr:hypothetical protein MJT46_004466 [Ovis ammon polii x Ovis aries]KAI4588709.1 hypothetical protein MJG53_003117 [Ovis ammon polii x Ovis aries]
MYEELLRVDKRKPGVTVTVGIWKYTDTDITNSLYTMRSIITLPQGLDSFWDRALPDGALDTALRGDEAGSEEDLYEDVHSSSHHYSHTGGGGEQLAINEPSPTWWWNLAGHIVLLVGDVPFQPLTNCPLSDALDEES